MVLIALLKKLQIICTEVFEEIKHARDFPALAIGSPTPSPACN
jgi:hypothetical protein